MQVFDPAKYNYFKPPTTNRTINLGKYSLREMLSGGSYSFFGDPQQLRYDEGKAIPTFVAGTTSGRLFVYVEETGNPNRWALLYRSLQGTGGKTAGDWFVTGGDTPDWIIKHEPEIGHGACGRPELEQLAASMNDILPHTDEDTDEWVLNITGMPSYYVKEHLKMHLLNFKFSNIADFWQREILTPIWGKKVERPIYFIGDVHSRPELVHAALDMAQGNRVVFLGDIFDGPGGPGGSVECLRLIKNAKNAELILGNHEAYGMSCKMQSERLAFFWGIDPNSTEAARVYQEWLDIYDRLDPTERAWLKDRPVYIQGDGWIAAHAKVPNGPLPDYKLALTYLPECKAKGKHDFVAQMEAQIEMLDNTAPLYPGHFWAQDYDGRHGFAIVGHTRLPKVGEFAWDHCILLDWDAKNAGTAAYAIWFDGEVVEVGGLDPLGRTSNPRERKPLTPEQKAREAENARRRWASRTPEQKAAEAARQRQRHATMTPEQREARLTWQREHGKRKWASMTPEERAAYNKRERERYAEMTPEELARHRERERERHRERYAAMTPEQRETYKKRKRDSWTPERKAEASERKHLRWIAMTPEERAVYNQHQRERRASIRERLERARLGVLAYFTKKEIEEMREEESIRRQFMTEEERTEERNAFRDRLDSIGFGAPDFAGLERLRQDELRAMAAFIASQRGTRYEEIMEDEEEEEETALEEGLDSEDFDSDLDEDDDSRESNPRKILTPEERRAANTERARRRRAAMTPEQRAEYNEYHRKLYHAMPPEKKAALIDRQLANMTPEQKKARSEASRRRRAAMTPEERAEYNKLNRERWAALPKEKKDAYTDKSRRRRAAMTPEERADYNEYHRNYIAAAREKLGRARSGILGRFSDNEIEGMIKEWRKSSQRMTEEEKAAERDAFRAMINRIASVSQNFEELGSISRADLRLIVSILAGQLGPEYEAMLEAEEVEEAEMLDEGDLDDDLEYYLDEYIEDDLDDDPSREPNPRVSAKRTDEALWKRIVKRITAGSKGGHPGQWSARKAQLAVAEYKAKGGEYIGKKSKDNSLHKWTVQDWRTKSGRASLETGERYLPAKAIEALSDEEYRETSRAKRAGLRKGKQFTPQPKKIAKKVAKYRKNNPAARDASGAEHDFGPGVSIEYGDFSGADFSGMDLRGADFRNIHINRHLDFSRADFTGANLEGAYFEHADLSGAIFRDANLAGAKIYSCPMSGAIFEGADLRDAAIYGVPEPQHCIDFRGTDFSGAEIMQLFITDSDFTGAKFKLNVEEMYDYQRDLLGDNTYARAVPPGIIEFLVYGKRNNCSGLDESSDFILSTFKSYLDQIHVEKRERAIAAGAYIGFVEGLWVHQTDEPQFEYHGELCVSPYSDTEERYYRGGRIFGVIMEGTAELFADDVWSTADVFGRLIPNRFEVRPEHHKEAFINGNTAKIIGLTYPKEAEEIPQCAAVIDEWRSRGYITIPIVSLPGRPRR